MSFWTLQCSCRESALHVQQSIYYLWMNVCLLSGRFGLQEKDEADDENSSGSLNLSTTEESTWVGCLMSITPHLTSQLEFPCSSSGDSLSTGSPWLCPSPKNEFPWEQLALRATQLSGSKSHVNLSTVNRHLRGRTAPTGRVLRSSWLMTAQCFFTIVGI